MTLQFAHVRNDFRWSGGITNAPVAGKVDFRAALDATLFDAGVGVRTTLRITFYPLWVRLDLPFYVNHPEINGESDEFRNRYVFSLSGSF